MANIMKEVANSLGVELGEEFRIEGCTMKYQLSETGLKFWSDTCKYWCPTYGLEEILTGVCKIIKPSELILDDAEKDYLSAVIKPFRDRVIYIRKLEDGTDGFIGMKLKYYANETDKETLLLPLFKRGTMYKNMKLDKEYTLEELGL